MNAARIAVSYLRARPLATLLNVLLLALGVGTIGFVRLVDSQVGDALERDARGVDLVVGAKGSPLQLILAGIYQLDAPTGNIPLAAMTELARNPQVAGVIPLSLGDSFRGFRIVGTTPDYVALYDGKLAAGRLWDATMQAVIGADVAARTRLAVGDRFAGAHGLAEGGGQHADAPYTVVGVLAPTGTVLDRLIVVDTASVWLVHEHRDAAGIAKASNDDAREITVLLVKYATPLAAASLPRRINAETRYQAASPAHESARLFRVVGVGADVIRAFGGVVLATAALSLFVALYHALNERAYDIAVLRTLGARPSRIARMLLFEAALLALAGGLVGLVLAHALVALLAAWMDAGEGLRVSPWRVSPDEVLLLVPAFVAAGLAALLPAWRASRANIAATLARRH